MLRCSKRNPNLCKLFFSDFSINLHKVYGKPNDNSNNHRLTRTMEHTLQASFFLTHCINNYPHVHPTVPQLHSPALRHRHEHPLRTKSHKETSIFHNPLGKGMRSNIIVDLLNLCQLPTNSTGGKARRIEPVGRCSSIRFPTCKLCIKITLPPPAITC